MSYIENEEKFTLGDFVKVFLKFIKELLAVKWWIIGSIALCAGIFLMRTLQKKTTYTAQLTFVIKDNNSNNIGAGVSAVLGQFGLGGGLADGMNFDKLVEFTRSEHIVQKALFNTVEIAGKSDFIANHLLEIYVEDRVNWEKYIKATLELEDTDLTSFSFRRDSLSEFTLVEQMFFDQLYVLVRGNEDIGGLMDIVYGDKSTILVLRAKSIQEDISIELVEALYQELSEFHIIEATESTKQAFQILDVKADSILRELNIIENRLSYEISLNESYVSDKEQLRRKRMNRNAQILTVMYGEVLKNKETTAFILQNQTPFFKVIDRPHRPIYPKTPSKLMALIVGSLVGAFLSLLVILLRKVLSTLLE